MIRGSCCSKSSLAKAAGAEVAAQQSYENGMPLWREAHLYVKMYKTPQRRSHFGSCDLQNWHAAVARSICVSQNVEKLTGTDHFLEV